MLLCSQRQRRRTINHRCCSFLQRPLLRNLKITETISNQPNNCPETRGRSFKGLSIFCCCSQTKLESDLYTSQTSDNCHFQLFLLRLYQPLLCNESQHMNRLYAQYQGFVFLYLFSPEGHD